MVRVLCLARMKGWIPPSESHHIYRMWWSRSTIPALVEAGGPKSSHHSPTHREFEGILDYMRPCLKKQTNKSLVIQGVQVYSRLQVYSWC